MTLLNSLKSTQKGLIPSFLSTTTMGKLQGDFDLRIVLASNISSMAWSTTPASSDAFGKISSSSADGFPCVPDLHQSLFCTSNSVIISRCFEGMSIPSVRSWEVEPFASSPVTEEIACSSTTFNQRIMQSRLCLKVLLVLLINRTGIARDGFVLARAFLTIKPGSLLA